jgi:excisionase family DNA binding protein
MATTKDRAETIKQSDWMTLDQIADELQVPKATLYVWRAKGDFPRSARCGKHVRVRRTDFDSWLDDKLED